MSAKELFSKVEPKNSTSVFKALIALQEEIFEKESIADFFQKEELGMYIFQINQLLNSNRIYPERSEFVFELALNVLDRFERIRFT